MGLVSVIVPVYNVEPYLAQAIESLLHQDGCDLEIILVDDGSTDRSGEIARDYEKRFQNIHYIYQDSAGVSAARNRGIALATGKYILFLDSDDFLNVNSLAPLIDKMDEEKLDLLLFSANKLLEDSGQSVPYGIDFDRFFDDGSEAYLYMRKNQQYYACVWYMLIRRETLKNSGIHFYEGIIHEDHLFFFQYLIQAKKVMCVSDRIYNYRIHKNSIMTSTVPYCIRFQGFCTCYLMMLSMFLNRNFESGEEELKEELIRHIKELGTIAGKYYVRMNHCQRREMHDMLQQFLKCIKNYKWSVRRDIRYLVCLRQIV